MKKGRFNRRKCLVRASRFERSIFSLAAAVFTCALALAEVRAAVPADFAKTFTVTIPTGLVDENETLTSFPLLLRLGTSIDGFDYADFRQNGADILVTDKNGSALPYELENWDTNGESRLWVRVPSVAEGTTLTVYYGSAEPVAPPEGMWSGYAGVWHFNEAGDGATTIADSTANAQNGTSHGSSIARSDGKLGAARGLELEAKNGAMTTVPNSTVLDDLVPTFTVSGWVRPKTLSLNWGYLFARKTSDADPYWGLQFRGKDGNSDSVAIYSNGNEDNDNKRAMFTTSGKFKKNTWTKYHVVYDDTTIYLYLDGALVASKPANPGPAVNKSNGFGIGGFPTSENHSSLQADQDEVRLMNGTISAAWVAAEYRQESGAVALSYGEVQDADATAPVVAVPALSRDPATGAFTISAELSNNVPVSVICDADGITNAMTTADSSLPMTYSATLAGLAENTTYACLVAATSTGGSVVKKTCPTVFYNGDLLVSKVSDANEDGLIPGSFRISRADTAHDLVVSYSVGGTAVAGQTYASLSGTATIPAGSASVDIEVVPIRDPKKVVDTTVVLTLAAGSYGINENNASATLTIVNTPPYSSLFAYHVLITVSGYAGESTLSDFPVLIALAADSPSGFDYADCAADGSDIRFLDERDNVLSHEIETWETGGTSYIWVKVPSLAGKNTQFSLYYGTNGVSQLPEVHATNVWSRYAAVFHGGSTIADATGKSATVKASTVTGSATGGKAGGVMTKGASIGVLFSNPVTSHALSSAAKVSVSGWFKRSNSRNTAIVASAKNDWPEAGFMALVENGTYFSIGVDGTHQGADGKGALTKDVWGHLAFSYDSTALKSYFNGISIYENASAKSLKDKGDAYWAFGSLNNQNVNCFQGAMDELRVFNGVASADWIKAECDSVDSPATFAVLDDVRPAGVPYVVNPVVTREAGVFSVTAEILEDIPASVVYDADGVTGAMATSDVELPMVYSATLSGLAADTTYECSVVATATGGTVVSNTCSTAFYTGELSVEKISDAAMKGTAPGSFRISRADTAHDLIVSYSVGGTAESGQTYVALSGTATIPAGSRFVDVPVVPIFDKQMTEDTTVVLTLAAGLYGIQANAGSAMLTIEGYKPVRPADYTWSFTATPSDAIRTTLGKNAYADFPVLVRLPVSVSEKLQSADGTDLFFTDEDDASLPFEVDTFNPSGTTLVWVKVPSLSSATEITGYFGGYANADNNTTAVWTDYVGVWHMNEASGTVADATGHGLGASPAKKSAVSVAHAAGAVGTARQTATSDVKDYLTIPNYNSLGVGGNFTFSCFYDATARKGYDRLVSRKETHDAGNGWEVEMANASNTLSARGASATSIPGTFSDLVSSGWMRFTFVYSGTTLSAYLNGAQIGTGTITAATDNGKPLSIGCDSDGSEAYFVGYVDEARLRKGALTATEVALEHATMDDAAFFDLGAIKAVDKTAQVFETPTAVRNANGSTTVIVVLAENNGDVGVIYDAGSAAITNIIQSNVAPGTYTDTPANLAADTTYRFAAYGKNANDTEVVKKGGVFYNGDLSVAKVSDAAELGLVPGAFRISRADTSHDLVVAYTVGGTAVEGQTYEALSGTATIPAGTNSVDIVVTPLIDTQTTVDTTVTVTLSAGLYGIDAQAGSAELTIVSLVALSGYNTWISPSNSLASIDCNWSTGVAPTSSDNVLFDGNFSTANCEWDAAATATVASWTQTADYTGTVQINTTYDNTFPALNVSGDVEILGGNWTHKINGANDGQKYHLKAIVGGDFTLAVGCKLDAEMKGYWAQKYPAGSAVSAHAASYDGFDKIYGNVYRPADLGAGSSSSGSATDNKSGGGAVWLEVGGAATLNGTINVRGRQFDGSNTACGSVYVKAKSCAGSGSILANFSAGSYYNGNRGAGGRVAIELTEATTLAFPTENVKINGINAGGSGGGGGTFYVKTADPAMPNGTLYLDDQRGKSYGARWHKPQAITAIPAGETWTFDAIVIRNYGMLAVPAGTTLNLPNGPQSVSATSTRKGGIRYDGGTINWGSAPYEFSGGWIFQANAPYAFDGDVVVHSGGAIGCLQFQGKTDFSDFTKCDITVNGNLTVESGGYLYANGGGPDMNINRDTVSFHGGQSAGASGNKAFDSVFAPRLPGYGTAKDDQATSAPGGGLLLLNVSGAFVNNGTVTANGSAASGAGASGGSIVLTAGTLSGTGTFKADSASGSNGSGGGGRIAVRLTNGGFAEGAETNFFARGATVVKDNASSDKSSSAGTVYLQGKSDREKGGTIYVRNDKNALNTNTYTPIPAGVTKGDVAPDAVADFKMAALVVGDCGRVKFFDELRLRSVEVELGSELDLNGMTLTVNSAKVGSVKLAPGTYAVDDDALEGFITDSATGGALVVKGGGFMLHVR